MVPVLLNPTDPLHRKPLFDSHAGELSWQYLREGGIIDTSHVRGQLLGMKRPTTTFVGR